MERVRLITLHWGFSSQLIVGIHLVPHVFEWVINSSLLFFCSALFRTLQTYLAFLPQIWTQLLSRISSARPQIISSTTSNFQLRRSFELRFWFYLRPCKTSEKNTHDMFFERWIRRPLVLMPWHWGRWGSLWVGGVGVVGVILQECCLSRWWFQRVFYIFTLIPGGIDPIWPIFFKWATSQYWWHSRRFVIRNP